MGRSTFLFFTALVTPFEGLMDMELLDLRMGLALPSSPSSSSSTLSSSATSCLTSAWHTRNRLRRQVGHLSEEIAAHYLQSWFVIDLISTCPLT